MPVWTNSGVRVFVASGMLCAAALGARLLPVRAEPEGVLGQHLALLDRNARLFAEKNRAALANDLTDNYARIGMLGEKRTRGEELAELQRLFRKATQLWETSQTSRLTVQGGDATHPTVATTLVQTKRSADVIGPDGRSQTMTWDVVDTEERISTPDGWKCRKRVVLKNAVSLDGAPYVPGETPTVAIAREQIQRAYNALANASNAGDRDALREMLATSFQASQVDGKTQTAGEWIAEIERRRKADWKSDVRYSITGISANGQQAIVGCQQTLLRQTPDKDGVIRTVRNTIGSRDRWVKRSGGWTLQRSETLLVELDIVQPLAAAGWNQARKTNNGLRDR